MVGNKHLFKHFQDNPLERQVLESIKKNSENNKDTCVPSEVVIQQEEKLLTPILEHLETKTKKYENEIQSVINPTKSEPLVEKVLSDKDKEVTILSQTNAHKKSKKKKTKKEKL